MPHHTDPISLTPKWAGQFTTFETWVNKAPSWIDKDAVCVDAKGRRCLIGRDFHRARDENAFPVRFFWECEPSPTPAPSPATDGDVTGTAKRIAWAYWLAMGAIDAKADPQRIWDAGTDQLRSAWLAAARAVPAPAQPDALPLGYIPMPQGLHPKTAGAVCALAEAVAAKLRLSEVKYGWTDNWTRDGWRDELVAELLRHVEKGDPRDVAAYCAFAIFHGWDVSPCQPQDATLRRQHTGEGRDNG